jgi:hypothetical protein
LAAVPFKKRRKNVLRVINQGRLVEAEKCPRRFYYRYQKNLRPKQESLVLRCGTAMHEGLRAHYSGGDPVGAFERSMDLYSPLPGTEGELAEARTLWRERLIAYGAEYPQEPFDVIAAPEQEIVAPLGNSGISLGMRLDLIVRRHADGLPWVVDHKTTSRTGTSYWPQYFVDLQGSAYVYGAQHFLGEKVGGWIINAIKSTKGGWFERNAFVRTDEQLRSFERQVVARVKRLDEAVMAVQADDNNLDSEFPQYTHECHGFGTCAFLSLCQGGPAALPIYGKREPDYIDKWPPS